MGMFDYVRAPKINCPHCDAEIPSEIWQSKDGPCYLETIDYWEVDEFYHFCNCGAWIQFNRKKPKIAVPITDYEMSFRPPEKRNP